VAGGLAQPPGLGQAASLPPLQLGQFQPSNRGFAAAVGDRLRVSGKERLVLSGTLAFSTGPSTPVQVTTQWPDNLRVDFGPGHTTFDGTTLGNGAGVAKKDEDLVNGFIFDFVDHYLAAQSQGAALRSIGPSHVRDGSTSTVWHYVQALDRARLAGKDIPVLKLYGFDVTTRLLQIVTYDLNIQGVNTHIQMRFQNWQLTNQQWLPGKITRFENGAATFTFVLTGGLITSAANDGAFKQ
jgi:hypothetical protein